MPIVCTSIDRVSSDSFSLSALTHPVADAGTGALILGGTDSSRYTGDLVALPIAAPAGTDPTPRLNVPWSSLSLTDSTGTSVLTNSDLPYPVVLDTASDFAFLPINLFDQLATYFDVQKTPQGVYRVSCDVGIGTLDFGFGDGPAVTISVPFSDVSVPSASANSSVCMFAFQPYKDSSQGVIAFGGTFLRSAYVQYNYDAMTISLAQASWDSTCDDCAVSI